MRPLRISAGWVFPVDREPLHNAAVLLDSAGRIAAVGPAETVPVPELAEQLELPQAALLPGLVNTHTHLELTGFAQSAPELEFLPWIESIRRLKQARPPEEFLAAARCGLAECWAAGITTIADTGDSGAVLEALSELSGSGIVYHEIFGPHPADRDACLAGFVRRVDELSRFAGARVRLGVSPHAPYSVSGPLYARVAAWARAHALPVAVHLAESRAESEFVSRCRGPFAAAWKFRGIPLLSDPSQRPDDGSARSAASGPLTPVAWLDRHAVLSAATLCIHTVQLSPADIAILADRGVAIAHCPLSNAAHRHGEAPLAELRRSGIRVGLGTDSVASVGTLDLFREARAARRLGGLSPAQALALATLEGARALDLEREIGSLTVGKWGDLLAVELPEAAGQAPPLSAVLRASPAEVALTVLGGRIVHRARPA